ncbi:aldo/keto reductase [Bacillus smithii]|uniref:aldo/keto reductase n=1 Tax=Bacillus smithii TaxID=1479 RepID=UPI002E20063C|nr:aldo/keto reductase [Bacillus smithii]MED1418957.1 aldo/keto reductase [Bacillus smithii]MED1455213.1 aldo/keto reductase [Bacillus smithii]
MEKRQLGRSALMVSKLGLGCMSLGTDAKQARTIIEAALDEGVNYFDTADLYDYGENEKIVGQTLKSVRDQVIIATKVGNRWNDKKDGWHWDPSKSYIKEAVKDSLRRLGTDYIDLYQLHGGTIDDPIEETIEAFEELKAEGIIRYYGISSIRPNVIRAYAKHSDIVSVMMQYNLLDRRPEEEALPLLHEHQISVVTRGPVAKGLLSTRWRKKADDSGYLNYSYPELKNLLSSIEDYFQNTRTLTEVALQFNLSHPAVAAVVVGASSVEQLKENVRAVNRPPLSEEEYSFLKKTTKTDLYEQHR